MDLELFYGWLSNHFTTWIPPARPVVLIVDGHSSHINLQTACFARENGILLYCLPPHTTHALQPCDVGVFGPIKKSWNKCVPRYVCDHSGEAVDKAKFARVFKGAWEDAIKISTIVNSFKTSGICPLNRRSVSAEKLSPSVVYKFREEQQKECEDVPVTSEDMVSVTSETSDTASEASVTSDNMVVTSPPPSSSLDINQPGTSGCTPADVPTVEISIHHLRKGLVDFEMELSDKDISTFEKQYENGYNLDLDPIYSQWKRLKDQIQDHEFAVITSESQKSPSSVPQSSKEHLTSPPMVITPSRRVSPALKNVLQKPTCMLKKKSGIRPGTLHMPKHMSGDTFIKLMEEKERKKREEIEEKEKCKLEREEKKKERERKKREEIEEKEKHKLEREEKKKEHERLKLAKQQEKERKFVFDVTESAKVSTKQRCPTPLSQEITF